MRSIHSRAWLNLLSPRDLSDLTIRSYAGRTGFETEEHNLDELWSWETAALRNHFRGCRSVLVAGAGGGREMIAVARMGLAVDGFDASPDLVEACRRNLAAAGVAGRIWLAGPGEAPRDAGLYDGLVVGRGVYHHIPSSANRVRFLEACREHLRPGSPVLIGDFLTRTANGRPRSAVGRAPEPGDHLNNAFFHFFSPEEVALECRQAGFELIAYNATPFPDAFNLAHAIARLSADVIPMHSQS